MLAELDARAIPSHVVLTKSDLVTTVELDALAARTAAALGGLRMPFPQLNAVSARGGEGLQELKDTLMQTSKVHRLRRDLHERHLEQLLAQRELENVTEKREIDESRKHASPAK